MKNCVIGKPCGNSCIARDRTCCMDPSTVVPASPVCSCGKPCGKGCIAQDRECYVDSTECVDVIVPYGALQPYPRPYTAPPFPAPIPAQFPIAQTPFPPQPFTPPVPEINFGGPSDVSALGCGTLA